MFLQLTLCLSVHFISGPGKSQAPYFIISRGVPTELCEHPLGDGASFALRGPCGGADAPRATGLLKLMWGDTQMLALADMIQALLMLKYNQRKIG